MLALIGGTGLYELPGMVIDERIDAPTPFGAASGAVVRGRVGGRELLFLARHGAGHRLLPHEVNYRANVFALKRAGATRLVTVSAVGSLAETIAPGDLALPGQYFDWTRGARRARFFGDGVAAHVSTARAGPFFSAAGAGRAAPGCGAPARPRTSRRRGRSAPGSPSGCARARRPSASRCTTT